MKNGRNPGGRRLPDRPKKVIKPVNPDQAVIDVLVRNKANASKRRPVEFFLYFPTEEAAVKAKLELEQKGFTVEYGPSAGGSNWLCLATKELVPSIANLTSIRTALERLANRLDGDYDGWGTAFEPEE